MNISDLHTKYISNEIQLKDIPDDIKQKLNYNHNIRKYDNSMKDYINYNNNDILLFSKIKNEENLLSVWLDYYKNLGVTVVIIILNNSTDNSLNILLSKRTKNFKIEILQDNRDFYEYEAEWARNLPKIYGINKWCLNVDVDEYLKFQCEHLTKIIPYLINNNQFFLPTYLLNLYPKINNVNTINDYKNLNDYFESLYHDFDNDITDQYNYQNNDFNFIDKDDKTYNQSRFNIFEQKINVYKRLNMLNEYFNIKREIKKISFFYMFSKNLNISGGFHHFYIIDQNKNKKKNIFSFFNDNNLIFYDKLYNKIEYDHTKFYTGIILHLFSYNLENLQSKFKNKIPTFYNQYISKKVDLEILPYFNYKELTMKKNDDGFAVKKYFENIFYFSNSWFYINLKDILNFFKFFQNKKIQSFLEIGSFEGQSTVFFITFFKHLKSFDIIDPFMNDGTQISNYNKSGIDKLKNIFLFNINKILKNENKNDIKYNIYQDLSTNILHKIKNKYDFIYIDGSHLSVDVFIDAFYSFHLLNDNGIIIFDDFKHSVYKELIYLSPSIAIYIFYKIFSKYIKIKYIKHSICFQKIENVNLLNDKNALNTIKELKYLTEKHKKKLKFFNLNNKILNYTEHILLSKKYCNVNSYIFLNKIIILYNDLKIHNVIYSPLYKFCDHKFNFIVYLYYYKALKDFIHYLLNNKCILFYQKENGDIIIKKISKKNIEKKDFNKKFNQYKKYIDDEKKILYRNF